MKKILLAGCAFLVALTMNAQTPGLDTTGSAFDDFASAPYGDATGGLFWWGDSILGSGQNPNFKAVLTRDTVAMKMDVVVTQEYNGFVPFGVGFGDSNGDGTGTVTTADFSGNSSYQVVLTNNSDSTVNIRVTPQDVNLNEVDTDTAWGLDPANGWKYVIDIQLAPGATDTLQAGSSNSESAILSGDYVGSSKADWACPTPPCQQKTLDLAVLKGFNVTVTNANKNAADNFAHYGLADVSISINSFRMGRAVVAVGLDDKAEVLKANLFPNPATSVLNFTEELEDVSVYNAQGLQVFTAEKATSINVEGMQSGVYVLRSSKGAKTFVVK